ncbi:MAG: glycosyltransferase family 4 protein [Clostridia bacterium]|jgi:colanic acid biosynthesis glycosyl transferase WcaI
MKILIISQYFYPETGACSNRITEFTKLWVLSGHQVSVLTSFPNYPIGRIYDGYREKKDSFLKESMEGVVIYRVKPIEARIDGKVARLKNYIGFMMKALYYIRRLPRHDVVIGTIGSLFTGIVGLIAGKILKVPFILEVRDIISLQIKATGYSNRIIMKLVEILENLMMKTSQHIVTVTDGFRNEIIRRGIPGEKVSVVKNGASFHRKAEILDMQDKDFCLLLKTIRSAKTKGRMILSYCGTLGISQNIHEMIKYVEKYKDQVIFLIIGDGACRNKLIEEIDRYKLSHTVYYHLNVPESHIVSLLRLSDFSFVKLLNSEEFGSFILSKIFHIMREKCLPVFIGPRGDAWNIVKQIDPRLCFNDGIDRIIPAF